MASSLLFLVLVLSCLFLAGPFSSSPFLMLCFFLFDSLNCFLLSSVVEQCCICIYATWWASKRQWILHYTLHWEQRCQILHVLQVALQTNTELLQLPDKYEASDSAAILAQVSADLNSPAESTRLEALHWVSTRHPCHLPQMQMLLHQQITAEAVTPPAASVHARHWRASSITERVPSVSAAQLVFRLNQLILQNSCLTKRA